MKIPIPRIEFEIIQMQFHVGATILIPYSRFSRIISTDLDDLEAGSFSDWITALIASGINDVMGALRTVKKAPDKKTKRRTLKTLGGD